MTQDMPTITISRAVAVYELNRARRLNLPSAKAIEMALYRAFVEDEKLNTLTLPKEDAALFSSNAINVSLENREHYMEAVYLRFLAELGQQLVDFQHDFEHVQRRHKLNTIVIVLLCLCVAVLTTHIFL